MTKLRCLPLGLLAVVLLNAFSAVAGEEIFIDPWELRAPNQPYENLEAVVGDTITFSWSPEENHTVYINPSGTCEFNENSVLLGDTSPVSYTFTAEDAVNSVLDEPVYFVDNIEQLCEWGMRFSVNVNTPTMSPTTAPPTTSPTTAPSDAPSTVPSGSPVTQAPTIAPSGGPTVSPSASPSSTPSASPIVAPSDAPTVDPSSSPSASPTIAPSGGPTVSPSASPSSTPSASPIVAASDAPTAAPSTSPSASPTIAASDVPSLTPTASPSTSPSTSMPSSVPTTTPSSAPTGSPSKTPTSPPVPFPTEVPTPRPTAIPTATPTNTPTVAPTPVPTNTPTVSPTAKITAEPTNSPTRAPLVVGEQVSETFTGLKMGVAGVSESMIVSNPNALTQWKFLTEEYSESYVFNDLKDSVANYVTSIEVTDFYPIESRRMLRGENRKLQDINIIVVEYTQTVTYNIIGSVAQITPEELVKAPFATTSARGAYVTVLKTSTNEVISGVVNVSEIQLQPEPEPEGFVWTRTIIIAVAAGGAGLLIVIILFLVYCRKGSGSAPNKDENPPLHVDVRNDEVSTLAGPDGPPTYGDQSVATVDYDYSKAYGGAGDTSVSSAGGTFGSQTQNLSLPANAAATGAALGAMDSDSFDDTYSPRSSQGTEEIIHIFAPPGKLGVVIDTPDDGAPVVHAVKETSVIADRILVGDKLVAVDDEDVRSMTAIKVSKMISRKGANPTRKLTIVRTVPPQ